MIKKIFSVTFFLVFVIIFTKLNFAKGWEIRNNDWYFIGDDNEVVVDTIKSSFDNKYYLGEDGDMKKDFFLENYGSGENNYYFGKDGAMVKNRWVAIDPNVVINNGDYIPNAYWFYFQSNGKAVKASSGQGIKKTVIDGKRYAFNEYGQMLTGWIDESGNIQNNEDYPYQNALYYAGDDNDGVLYSGWLPYKDDVETEFSEKDEIWFYFNPTNNKKEGADNKGVYKSLNGEITYKIKKINGKTYAFSNISGIMLSKWDGYSTKSNSWYFSQDNDGKRVQKGFVYDVPTEDIDEDYHKDEEKKFMYFAQNGDLVKDTIKKINGKYYAFSRKGLMVNGLNAFSCGRHIVRFDPDETSGKDMAKASMIRYKDHTWKCFEGSSGNIITYDRKPIYVHNFGIDGIRKIGNNEIEMVDDTHIFGSNASGHFQGLKKKKYYSNGILLKASPDIRYGLIVATDSMLRKAVDYKTIDEKGGLFVLNTNAQKVKGSNTAKKDVIGNFWLINKNASKNEDGVNINTDEFIGIYTVDVKYDNEKGFMYKGDVYDKKTKSVKTNTWIKFGEYDINNNTCSNVKLKNDYQFNPMNDEDYALNFFWKGSSYDGKFAIPIGTVEDPAYFANLNR